MSSIKERMTRQRVMYWAEKKESRRVRDFEDAFPIYVAPRILAPLFSVPEIEATPNPREIPELIEMWKKFQYDRAVSKLGEGTGTKQDRQFVHRSNDKLGQS